MLSLIRQTPIPYDIINLYKTIILKLGISRRVNPGSRTRIGPDLKKNKKSKTLIDLIKNPVISIQKSSSNSLTIYLFLRKIILF
jgi:hypothetical protein